MERVRGKAFDAIFHIRADAVWLLPVQNVAFTFTDVQADSDCAEDVCYIGVGDQAALYLRGLARPHMNFIDVFATPDDGRFMRNFAIAYKSRFRVQNKDDPGVTDTLFVYMVSLLGITQGKSRVINTYTVGRLLNRGQLEFSQCFNHFPTPVLELCALANKDHRYWGEPGSPGRLRIHQASQETAAFSPEQASAFIAAQTEAELSALFGFDVSTYLDVAESDDLGPRQNCEHHAIYMQSGQAMMPRMDCIRAVDPCARAFPLASASAWCAVRTQLSSENE